MEAESRLERIRRAVASQHESNIVAAAVRATCAVLGCDDASVMVQSELGLFTVNGSALLSQAGDSAQVTLGEGPSLSAVETGLPMVVHDVHLSDARWPRLSEALTDAPVGAMLALALGHGRARLGVLTAYWGTQTMISAEMLADGIVLADLVNELVLQHLADVDVDLDGAIVTATLGAPVVQQAVGMLAERYGISVVDAQVRLRARAYASTTAIEDLARSIVDRTDEWRDE